MMRYIKASTGFASLTGKKIANDGKAIVDVLKGIIKYGTLKHIGNFVFEAEGKDGNKIRIYTSPVGDMDGDNAYDEIVIDSIKGCANSSKITAAQDGGEIAETVEDKISTLQDNFDYIVSGIELLGRSGASTTQEAEVIIEKLSDTFSTYIAEIGNLVQGV